MPDNPQEQTEAKLLAYIEGDLDESGRAEIERHIEANPKHRKLLDELSAGRRLLRLLPREVAPFDLYENVQSQLERQELLESVATLGGGVDGGESGNGFGTGVSINPETGNFRLTRWGRVRAAAAIALLASGLGIVAFNVAAPRGTPNVAIRTNPPTLPADVRGEGLAKIEGSGDGLGGVADRFANRVLQSIDDSRRLRMASAADHVRGLTEVRDALGDSRKEMRAMEKAAVRRSATSAADEGDATPDTAGHEAMYLVVASGDPASARDDVLAMLSEKGLTYSRVSVETTGNSPGVLSPQGELDRKRVDDQATTPAPSPTPFDKPSPVEQPSAAGAALARGPTPHVQEVVIVRRVLRSRAAELVAAMNQPASARYAMGYGGTAIAPAKPNAYAAKTAGPGQALKSTFGGSGSIAKKAASPEPAKGELTEPSGADGGFDKIANGAPAARPTEPAMPAGAAAPVAADGAQKGAVASKPAADRSVEIAGGGAGGGTAPSAKARSDNAASEKAKQQANSAPKPGAVGAPAQPAPVALPMAAAAPTRPAIADSGPRGGHPSPANHPEVAADTNVSRPLAANDAIELVYLDMRRNGRPVAQPMRVSEKGTIFVAGLGEVAVAGLTTVEAAAKLSGAVRDKTPTSKGYEIRRPTGQYDALAQGQMTELERQQSAVPVPATADPQSRDANMGDRPVRKDLTPGATSAGESAPSATRVAPIAKAIPAAPPSPMMPQNAQGAVPKPVAPTPSPAESTAVDDDFVDVVIVLQRDVSGEEGATPVSPAGPNR